MSTPLPPAVQSFVDAARAGFGEALHSIVLYGSAAADRLRASSDVNLLVVLHRLDRGAAEAVRGPLRQGHVAAKLRVMFLLRDEVAPAVEKFASKFSHIIRQHRMLHGPDPFAEVQVAPRAVLLRAQQELLNLQLRLRALYVEQGEPEGQLVLAVAQAAGPLRGCAATLLTLEGAASAAGTSGSSKDALQSLALRLDGGCAPLLTALSQARETTVLPSGSAAETLFGLSELAGKLYRHAETLAP